MPSQWTETAPDADLIEACLNGDDTAWAALVQRYRRLIYTIPLRFDMSPVEAEEVFQEVCLILLENLHGLRDRNRLSAWLVTTTRRTCIEHWRRLRQTGGFQKLDERLDEEQDRLEQALLDLERRHTLQVALEQLDERCRRLLEAMFLSEEPPAYSEIARKIGMPEGSIGPTRARCLAKLRKFFAKIEDE
jgi:RNA polymerase sigma factor (sigma-70 family)